MNNIRWTILKRTEPRQNLNTSNSLGPYIWIFSVSHHSISMLRSCQQETMLLMERMTDAEMLSSYRLKNTRWWTSIQNVCTFCFHRIHLDISFLKSPSNCCDLNALIHSAYLYLYIIYLSSGALLLKMLFSFERELPWYQPCYLIPLPS